MAIRASIEETSGTGADRRRLLAGLPLTERRHDVNGLATTVLEGGAGPPLVLLHGGIECGGAYWAPVVPQLAERHRIVVPDVPGLGESEPAGEVEAAFDDWFSELLRATCDEAPTVLAHSLGGALAARFALQRGGLTQLLLYGSPGIGPYRLPLGLIVTALRFDLRPTLRNQERFEQWAFHDVHRTKLQDPDWFRAFDDYCVSRASVPHVKRTMRRLIRTQTKQIPESELRRIGVPTSILWGRHDRMVSLRLAEDASSALGWPLHVIEDAGHVPHLERSDRFVQALSKALASR
jgi:2-hydroxymuconate-semialdehyde hydrolase